ncbi:hypothetical protein ACFQ64_16290 [Streptomyces sp. NPDC056460]|uniref:DUF7683 domain-containing protein n=1 Tax=Streptomyces sp. NPDC056460 TaxID=3345825 RepID=UPI0036C034C4
MLMPKWVIEEFDRESGRFLGRHDLAGLSDDDAGSLLGFPDLGSGDLYDISGDALAELSLRFGLEVSPGEYEYLLGRESSDSS